MRLKKIFLCRSIRSSAIEVFNVPSVSVEHSEFPGAGAGALALSRVSDLAVAGSLLDRAAVGLVPNATRVSYRCSAAPGGGQVPAGDHGCTVVGRRPAGAGAYPAAAFGAESAGAIVLAVVSAMLLLTAVVILLFLHKTGKLEHYI